MTIISKAIYELPESERFIKISNGIKIKSDEKDGSGHLKEKVAIVLPTYNERENLLLLIPVIQEIFEKRDINGYLIIVDDNSKDGTAKIAIRFARTYQNIVVIQRPGKLGLGSAYRLGFKKALDMDMDIIFEMDADLSHRPSYIPEFIKNIKNTGAGLVIGSRYCGNGATKDWPFTRKLISHGGNFITRIMLGINKTKDMTSGFRAYTADTLRAIHFKNFTTNGYAWQIETLYYTTIRQKNVSEIPIVFHEREIGQSKLGTGDVKEFLVFLLKTMFQRVKKIFHVDEVYFLRK